MAVELFERAVKHLEASRYAAACPLLKESYDLEPLPGVLFTLAECEARRGRIATSLRRYDEYIAMYSALPPAKKAKQGTRLAEARERIAELEPDVPKLTLVLLPGSPSGTIVRFDGALVVVPATGLALSIDPGEHRITTQSPDGPVTEFRTQARKGTHESVSIFVNLASRLAGPPGKVGTPDMSKLRNR